MPYTRMRRLAGTYDQWQVANPVLLPAEAGYEDQQDGTYKVKIGDGISHWKDLPYAVNYQAILAAQTAAAQSEVNAASHEANALTYKNSANDSAAAALASQNAAKGSEDSSAVYASETLNDKNTAAQALADLLATLGTAVVPLVGGKIPIQYIPATSITDYLSVTDSSELTSLTAQKTDFAYVMGVNENNEPIVKETWQLLGDDPTVFSNWVPWGSTYATTAGNAVTAETANNSTQINGHRMVFMTESQYSGAVLDPDTYYCVGVDS